MSFLPPSLLPQALLGSGGGLTAVDPTLTIATWITFGLLFLLVGRFAWRPLIAAIDERERKIREDVAGAARARDEAEALLKSYEARLLATRKEADAILAEARGDAERFHKEAVGRADEEAKARVEKSVRAIEEERAKAVKELRTFAADAAVDLARKILKAEIDPAKHRALIDEFGKH